MNAYKLKLQYTDNLSVHRTEHDIEAADEPAATIEANTIMASLTDYTITKAELITLGPCTDLLA